MKKVIIKEEDLEFVILEEITNNSIVGIKFKNGEKCMLTFFKNLFEESGFGSIGLRERSSRLNQWVGDSKKAYVEETCKVQGSEAFVFKTHEELFNWLKE